MNSVFSRIRSAFGMYDDRLPGIGGLPSFHERLPEARVEELEGTVSEQKEQMERAVSLLQNAAFLAGYHQPPLARDIRLFLSEVRSSPNEGPMAGTSA